MELNRIFEKVILRSGQFLLDTEGIELQEDRFRNLVEDALSTYNRFAPYDQHVNISVGSPRQVRLDPNLMQNLTGCEYLGTPDWVSDATPSRLYGINPSYIFKNLDPNFNPNLIDKAQLPWVYRKPILTLPMSSEWDVHCVWKHRVTETEGNDGKFIYNIPTLDETEADKLIKLVQGLFLQGIGRSRRAFTMNDLPIIMDGGEIAGEGVEMEREAIDDLENIQKLYLAW